MGDGMRLPIRVEADSLIDDDGILICFTKGASPVELALIVNSVNGYGAAVGLMTRAHELVSAAIMDHIYDIEGGEKIPKDCPYKVLESDILAAIGAHNRAREQAQVSAVSEGWMFLQGR